MKSRYWYNAVSGARTGIVKAGCEYVEFNPNKEYEKLMIVFAKNMEKMN